MRLSLFRVLVTWTTFATQKLNPLELTISSLQLQLVATRPNYASSVSYESTATHECARRVLCSGIGNGDISDNANCVRSGLRAQIAALPHVVDLVSNFVDNAHPRLWSLSRACEENLLGLAKRLSARLHVKAPGVYASDYDDRSMLSHRAWIQQCAKARISAVQHDNLEMIEWLDAYCPHVPLDLAILEEARLGNVRLLQWFTDRHLGESCTAQLMDVAARGNQGRIENGSYSGQVAIGSQGFSKHGSQIGSHLRAHVSTHSHSLTLRFARPRTRRRNQPCCCRPSARHRAHSTVAAHAPALLSQPYALLSRVHALLARARVLLALAQGLL